MMGDRMFAKMDERLHSATATQMTFMTHSSSTPQELQKPDGPVRVPRSHSIRTAFVHPNHASTRDTAMAEVGDRLVDLFQGISFADQSVETQPPGPAEAHQLRNVHIRPAIAAVRAGQHFVKMQRQRVKTRMPRALCRHTDENRPPFG